MPEIAGVVAFREPRKGVQEPFITVGASELTYQTGNAAYRVSGGAFFQTNRFLIDELIRIVTAERSGELAIDLYAGVGLFSTALACNFRHIISVESSQTAADDLQYNLPVNGKAVRATAEQYLSELGDQGRPSDTLPQVLPPDLIVVDPPRSGLGERVARLLASANAPRVTYVSCDPSTLARDLVPLQAAGYRIDEAHLDRLVSSNFPCRERRAISPLTHNDFGSRSKCWPAHDLGWRAILVRARSSLPPDTGWSVILACRAILGGAALQRCDNRVPFTAALAAEVSSVCS